MSDRELAALYALVRDAHGLTREILDSQKLTLPRGKMKNLLRTLEAGLRENHHPTYAE